MMAAYGAQKGHVGRDEMHILAFSVPALQSFWRWSPRMHSTGRLLRCVNFWREHRHHELFGKRNTPPAEALEPALEHAGTLQSDWSDFKTLTNLVLTSNRISGGIPTTLAPNLKMLALDLNLLSGDPIPASHRQNARAISARPWSAFKVQLLPVLFG